jgi:hypothetical protein
MLKTPICFKTTLPTVALAKVWLASRSFSEGVACPP